MKMQKIIVNNALSNRVANTFKSAIVSRNVIEKNKIEFVIDATECKTLFDYFCKKFRIDMRKEDEGK
jgi:hypothetical protein